MYVTDTCECWFIRRAHAGWQRFLGLQHALYVQNVWARPMKVFTAVARLTRDTWPTLIEWSQLVATCRVLQLRVDVIVIGINHAVITWPWLRFYRSSTTQCVSISSYDLYQTKHGYWTRFCCLEPMIIEIINALRKCLFSINIHNNNLTTIVFDTLYYLHHCTIVREFP